MNETSNETQGRKSRRRTPSKAGALFAGLGVLSVGLHSWARSSEDVGANITQSAPPDENLDVAVEASPAANNIAVGTVVAAVVAAELAVFSAVTSYLTSAAGGPVIYPPGHSTSSSAGAPDDCMSCAYPPPEEIEGMLDLLAESEPAEGLNASLEFMERYDETVDYVLSERELTEQERRVVLDALNEQAKLIERVESYEFDSKEDAAAVDAWLDEQRVRYRWRSTLVR